MKPTLYKNKLNFGKVDYNDIGSKQNEVTVEIELRGTQRPHELRRLEYGGAPKDLELSICGNVWNRTHTDILSGGQNYDMLLELFPDTPLMHEIVGVWKRWHLNGMNAGCEHQRDWKTDEMLTTYEYRRTTETSNKRRELKEQAIDAALNGEALQLAQTEKDILRSEYFIKSDSSTPPEGYEQNDIKHYPAGHTRPSEHPRGLLTKPCKVCGYKYGSEWKHEELPREIIKQVIGWGERLAKSIT